MAIPTTLPASWYCSPALHQLERRAVFLRSWFFLGTINKFQTGETARFEIAQIELTVVTTAAGGSSAKTVKVLNASNGEELRSQQTRTGLVFTTISSEAPSFDDFFPGLQDLLDSYDFTRLPHRRSLTYDGNFNWKTMMDGFQECLHCQFTHPGLSKLYPPTFYRVVNHHNWSRHFSNPDRDDDGLFLFFFPISTLNLYNGGMSTFRACPSAKPGVSRMEFDYYNLVSGEEFEEYYKFVRQVANEDFDLCERAQANLEKGVYTEGCLNPEKETGVVFYQDRVFEMVMAQHAREKEQRSGNP
ncbi:hypothetical protein A1O7_08868 [Cladophialophora yegresii CBS 114405]|uniref:Choline monooxygenase, chloroplastic n=1 Tax=Cladophialophora yegresii CBS 114405 TaxID=1182544 RepID=W9VJT3_9EURO|nr:uncharacterized protein A1O7_08868 [Cladophialophora yegresii CBS 114405]EXJ55937.1 hypothetical protein A1O7_08868 [Cladophialophora yegresii CBS 114405]